MWIKSLIKKILPKEFIRRLKDNDVFKKLTVNIGWLFLEQLLLMFISSIISIWMIRYLGAENYGILSYSTAFVINFYGISNLGLGGIVVKEIISFPEKKNDLLGTTFILRIISGLFVIGIVFISIILARPNEHLTQWMVLIIAIGTLLDVCVGIEYWFQAKIISKYTVYAKSLALIISSLLKVAAILLSAPLIVFAGIFVINLLLYNCFLIFFYKNNGEKLIYWDFKCSIAIDLLKKSWPLMLSGAFVLINMNIDKIMLSEMLGNKEVGLYSVATIISSLAYFIPVAIGNSITPVLIEEREIKGIESYLKKLQKTYKLMTKISIILICIFSIGSPMLISCLFGQDYVIAAKVLVIHIWTTIFVFHVSIRSQVLIIENLQIFVTIFAFITMVFNIVLNYFFIKSYGIIGAAYASLISWALTVLLLPLLFKKTKNTVPMFIKSFLP